jgi:hypothetical protein
MGTYVNNLRLLEITTGDESGTWGTKTNTNLELIADAFGSGTEAITTNADTHTTTIADGAADEGRAIFLKYTGTLDSACTITIAPNTVNKLWFIENATSGSQNIIISQGSGANITIGNGKVAAVYTDGAGSGAAVLDAFADLELSSTLTVGDDLSLASDAAVLNFGADSDVSLTHVADTGLLLNSTRQLQFNDASQYISGADATTMHIYATDSVVLQTTLADLNANLDVSGTSTLGGTLTVNAGAVFNEASADVDFRVESNGQANMLFVDAGNDRVGIKQASPGRVLDVEGKFEVQDGIVYWGATANQGILTWDTSLARIGGTSGNKLELIAGGSIAQTITTSGDVGIGVAAPHAKLTVKDATDISMDSSGSGQFAVTGNGYTGAIALDSGYMNIYHNGGSAGIAFGTNETGRMYIDSAGIVTIGRTSGQAFTVTGHQFYSGGAYYNATAAGEVVRWYDANSGNDVGSIDTTSSNTAYNTSSDRRLKENIETADSSGSLIDDIEIVKHDWIASDDYVRYGVIAQDLFEVVPEAVSRGTDGDLVDEEVSGDEMPTKQVWGVDYSKLVPLLVKEVQHLRTRVAELES